MKFKKHISLFLAVFLLVSNLGLAFNVHYCKGQIASVSTIYNLDEPCEMNSSHDENDGCTIEFENDHKSCCSDLIIASDFDDVVIKFVSFDFQYFVVLKEVKQITFNKLVLIANNSFSTYCFEANAPPLYKLFSQFILYA